MAKRRHYIAEFKTRVVLELLTAQKGLMQASRDYEIKDTILSRCKQEFLERAPQLFLENRRIIMKQTCELPNWSVWLEN
jgi:transposase